MHQIRCHISTNTTPPSKQGPASLKNSLTGCGVSTVSIAIRQPFRPRFFIPRRVFPPVGPAGLVGALPPRLATTLTPALALFLPCFVAPDPVTAGGFADDLEVDLADDLADLAFAFRPAAAAGFAA